MDVALRALTPEQTASSSPDSPETVRAAVHAEAAAQARWNLATRVAFRFFALYFALYICSTQMFFSLVVRPSWMPRIPSLGNNDTVVKGGTWFAADVFGYPKPLVMISGSGDTPYAWGLAALMLAVAMAGTLLWSLLDRKRPNYATAQKWFRVFLRFGLGGSLVTYGAMKAIPVQMPIPNLTRLLEPYGHFSLMGVLWAQVGASPAYERFTGVTELLAGILLFIPGLTLLGALVSFSAVTMVFVLNMTYDVPVKLFAFHMVAMSVMLMAPDRTRLLNLFILNRPAPGPSEPPLVRNRWGSAVAICAQLAFGTWLVWSSYSGYSLAYRMRGPDAPKPPLYGIWDVSRMYVDGVERLPLVTDYDRWRRVVIQTATGIAFQRMDDTFTWVGGKVDMAGKSIALTPFTSGPATPGAPPRSLGRFAFEQPAADRLILDGDMDGRKVRMELAYYDRSNFRLVNQPKFRWVQDQPFNR